MTDGRPVGIILLDIWQVSGLYSIAAKQGSTTTPAMKRGQVLPPERMKNTKERGTATERAERFRALIMVGYLQRC